MTNSANRLRLCSCLLFMLCAPKLPLAPGHWVKPAASPGEIAAQYRACLAQADRAAATDRAIDHDILATRSEDWERAGTLRLQLGNMRANETVDARTVFARCMRANGYQPAQRRSG